MDRNLCLCGMNTFNLISKNRYSLSRSPLPPSFSHPITSVTSHEEENVLNLNYAMSLDKLVSNLKEKSSPGVPDISFVVKDEGRSISLSCNAAFFSLVVIPTDRYGLQSSCYL